LEKTAGDKDQEIMILQAAMITRLSNCQMHNRYSCHFWKESKKNLIPLSTESSLADDTANAQIDTLILDNRKKLNQIIGEPHALSCHLG